MDRRAGMKTMTVRMFQHSRTFLSFSRKFLQDFLRLIIQIPEEEEKDEKKGLDKPDSKRKCKDDDDDDDEDLPSFFKRKTSIQVQSMPKGRNSSRRASKTVDNDDEEAGGDIFTKTLSKMKENRGKSNIGVKKTSFSSYGQSPHPGSRKK